MAFFQGGVEWCTAFLFLGQMYVFTNIFFLSGWDPWTLRDAAIQVSQGEYENAMWYMTYFSRYPNNMFLMYLNALILWINSAVGIFTEEYAMLSCLIVTCLINSITCLLVYKTLRLFVSKTYAFAGYLLAVVSVGLSPWTVIFYSDSVGIVFPILCFYLYIKPVENKKTRILIRLLSAVTAAIGYCIKPQCVIIFIAIVGLELLHFIITRDPKKLLKSAGLVLSFVLCLLIVNGTIDTINKKNGFVINEEKTFGMAHFLMMGLNEHAGGVWSGEDVEFSESFATSEERTQANVNAAMQRMKDMGFTGTAKHIAKKMLTTFHDGTFAWGQEGHFYLQEFENRNSKVTPFLKSIYYQDGSKHELFVLFEQFIWILILFLAICSSFTKFQSGIWSRINILWIAIFGLILFEALFEVRARYVYTYVPIFCILAVFGVKNMMGLKMETNSFHKIDKAE